MTMLAMILALALVILLFTFFFAFVLLDDDDLTPDYPMWDAEDDIGTVGGDRR